MVGIVWSDLKGLFREQNSSEIPLKNKQHLIFEFCDIISAFSNYEHMSMIWKDFSYRQYLRGYKRLWDLMYNVNVKS